MNHKAELALHRFLDKATDGEKVLSDANIDKIAEDIKEALHRQFGSQNNRKEFRLRMSNIGKPTCQLWFEKNQPEKALPLPNNFVMNMMLGDIVEAVFKGLLRQAGVAYDDSKKVSMELKIDSKIEGTYDIVMDDAVDDIKSASDWSYKNKFESFETLNEGDAFGYISQLAGYAKATKTKVGGWWVVNKANGKYKYVSAHNLNLEKEMDNIKATLKKVKENKFERCFEPEEETFRGKRTGNKVLSKNCTFCDFKKACWENLVEAPAVMSKAQFPKIVSYVELNKENVI